MIKLLIPMICLVFLNGCATMQRVAFPKATSAIVFRAWETIKPSRQDTESTLRQVRDQKKVRNKLCVD